MISSDTILTSAGCLSQSTFLDLPWPQNLHAKLANNEYVTGGTVILHPQLDNMDNNLALIKLTEPVKFGPNVELR